MSSSVSLIHDDEFVKKKNAFSWVHNHFRINRDPKKHLAKCDVCNENVSGGSEKHGNSTNSLTRHLEKNHANDRSSLLPENAAEIIFLRTAWRKVEELRKRKREEGP